MAQPCNFPESNGVLGKPPGMTADECEALCVAHATMDEMPVVISCWKLTVEELAEVNRTGRLWLTVLGNTMPPVIVAGCKPFGEAAASS